LLRLGSWWHHECHDTTAGRRLEQKKEKLVIRTQLETKRLKLRLFNDEDIQIMFELNSDPEIIRYAEATPASDLDEARQRLEQGPLSDYAKYGFGRFAVELKETGNVIGFCGIKYLPEIDLPEIGYRFLK
jgi:ribosomal-protein-alanine N-acetyltransferase